MRAFAFVVLVAMATAACTSDPATDGALTSNVTSPTSATAEIAPPHEMLRVKRRVGPSKTATADTRDRARIPATTDLRQAEVLRQHGEWTVVRSKDAATDEVACAAVHRQGGRVQLGSDGLYLNFKGNGAGVGSYKLSYDGKPAIGIRLTVPLDTIALKDVNRLKGANQLKVSVQTVLRDSVDLDLDLNGLRDAHAALTGPDCAA